ncbi:MAG: class I SAM-dependent methyltransferase [Hyphomonas sp.]|nr:class I SAM-dependent methyltransferase [Hyphomonas sp.]MCB9960770.1 class I SAM-dependent methyltransferase [Hyphomonas sp.]MCB9971881.1 class I SAM-dependent methyltransferase [Hyphomonas sp.]
MSADAAVPHEPVPSEPLPNQTVPHLHERSSIVPELGEAVHCRHCGEPLSVRLVDLGTSPIANDYVAPERYAMAEPFYPLEVWVCSKCALAQTRDVLAADNIFREDYAYFSSASTSFLAHAKSYAEDMIERFNIGPDSKVVELACNDGYLLQYVQAKNVPCVGVEPCESVAAVARSKGIDTRVEFFGRELAERLAAEGHSADLMIANNVLAHVPDINDFVGGAEVLLKPEGVAVYEIQHLLRLMQNLQFDTIYHEHFSYISILAAENFFASNGMRLFDAESQWTHGGSIRLFACRKDASHQPTARLAALRAEEEAYGLNRAETYEAWGEKVRGIKRDLLELLIDLKRQGKSIAAYGAPAKAGTLLNFCGVARDFIDFTCDLAPSKQGKFVPGVRVPILPPEAISEHKPDYVLILVWNIKDEVMKQLSGIREWGGKFVVPVPVPAVLD